MCRKVIVIDDNLNHLMLEKDLLEVAGFAVSGASSGKDALALIRKEKPVIIIMDVRLADMRGTEIARILRQDEDLKEIPIVFVTASVLAEERGEIESIPNSGFIGKPINTRTFVEEIIKYIK